MIAMFAKKQRPSRYGDLPKDNGAPAISNAAVYTTAGQEIFSAMGAAGVAVTEQTAMQCSAVYACVSLIGGAISSMPLPVYKRTPDGRERVDHDVWWLLNEQPSNGYSAAVFWESMLGSLLLNGDAFAKIIRHSPMSNKIIGFEWIHASRVTVRRVGKDLSYTVQPNLLFTSDAKMETIPAVDMIHVAGPGFNGLRGMSQIRYVLRHAAGIALAAGQYSEDFFKNGARPDFAIELDGKPTPEQQEMMRKSWEDRYQGTGRAHLPALLTSGAKVHELTMNAEDTQLLATRQFQIEDICRIFGTPPFMVGHTQNTSSWGTGVEQMGIGFVKYTLARHLTKIEQELNRKIWPNSLAYMVEFNTAGLERGDFASRNTGYRIAIGRAGEPGWMTPNEVRRLDNMPPIDGGDILNTGIKETQTLPPTDNVNP